MNLYSLFVYIEHNGDESPKANLEGCTISLTYDTNFVYLKFMYETDSQFKKNPCNCELYVNTAQRYKWAAGTFFGGAREPRGGGFVTAGSRLNGRRYRLF